MIMPGEKAPDFTLPAVGGGSRSLSESLADSPVLVAFFKISCPTCQFTAPYLERIAGGRLRVLAVSQDDASGTRQFLDRFAPGLDTAMDTESGYPVCSAFGITHVPSLFLVEQDGTIGAAANGFHRQMLLDIGGRAGKAPFLEGEQVPEMRPG